MTISGKRILLIDGAHYDRLRKVLGIVIDFGVLRTVLAEDGPISSAHYHRDLRDADEAHRQQGLLDWLSRHGFEVLGDDNSEVGDLPRERYGTNLVGLAIDAMELAQSGDEVLLMGGDFKLAPLVISLVERSVKVTLVSTLHAPPSIAPHEHLVAECSAFIDLHDHREAIART
ncbi:MAG: NYN domain-containing protein [Devosia indica]